MTTATSRDRQVHWRAGSLASGPWTVELTPEVAGWRWSSLRVLTLEAGGSQSFPSGGEELVVLPLAGQCSVDCDTEHIALAGRPDVFSGPSDFAYVPCRAAVTVSSSAGGRFAVAGAQAERQLAPRHQVMSDVAVELRGAGNCSRRIVNYCMADTYEADRILVCEVVTPSGNWSSYPPHKHDEERDGETELEEIYYFEIAGRPEGPGAAYFKMFGTEQRPIEFLGELGDGDVVAVPHGYHGPSMAPPGYDLYFLNVMAGPERAWLASDDPAHAWVRATWTGQPVDPRLLTGSLGTRGS